MSATVTVEVADPAGVDGGTELGTAMTAVTVPVGSVVRATVPVLAGVPVADGAKAAAGAGLVVGNKVGLRAAVGNVVGARVAVGNAPAANPIPEETRPLAKA